MDSTKVLYQANQRYSQISSCSFKLDYFKKLFNILCDINEEAAQLAVAELKKTPEQSEEDFNKLKIVAKLLYKVVVQIFGSKGEYIVSDSELIFDESKLPDSINQIIFDNTTHHKIKTNIEPLFKVVVQFDFTKPPIFDFISHASLATKNNSFVQILGVKETWVSGSYEKIISSLKATGTKRAWLHRKNVYDLILWFAYIPLVFWNLFKCEPYISNIFNNSSPVLTVAIYVYFFFAALFIFRILFNYSKWVFPYMELLTSMRRGAIAHRIFFGALTLGLTISLLKEFIRSIFKLLF